MFFFFKLSVIDLQHTRNQLFICASGNENNDKMRNYYTIKYIMFYIDFTSVGFKGESV